MRNKRHDPMDMLHATVWGPVFSGSRDVVWGEVLKDYRYVAKLAQTCKLFAQTLPFMQDVWWTIAQNCAPIPRPILCSMFALDTADLPGYDRVVCNLHRSYNMQVRTPSAALLCALRKHGSMSNMVRRRRRQRQRSGNMLSAEDEGPRSWPLGTQFSRFDAHFISVLQKFWLEQGGVNAVVRIPRKMLFLALQSHCNAVMGAAASSGSVCRFDAAWLQRYMVRLWICSNERGVDWDILSREWVLDFPALLHRFAPWTAQRVLRLNIVL